MVRFTIISAIIFLVGTAVAYNMPTSLFSVLQWIGAAGLVVSVVRYSFRLFRWLKYQLLWKVRNKIIISFSFVGLIPVIILVFIGWLSITLIFRQLSVVYLQEEFQAISDSLGNTTSRIVLRSYRSGASGRPRLIELLRREQASFEEVHPGLGGSTFWLLARLPGPVSADYRVEAVFPPQDSLPVSVLVPPWARDGYDGMVSDGGEVFFRSLLPLRDGNRDYLVYLSLPLNQRVLNHIRQRTSIDFGIISRSEFGAPAISEFFSSGKLFNIRWADILQPVDWQEQVNPVSLDYGIVLEVPLRALFDHYFTKSSGFGTVVVAIIVILGLAFVLVEVVSLLIGVTIARSITRSIHNIDVGARNIREGNLDFRIQSGNRDQLDAVAEAFNRMSESVVQLMHEVSDKERLEKEIEIAREVQTHLFPRELPQVTGFELSGTCLPARRVSGDYYDFIPYALDYLDIIIADISGKGISAALLMASLQSSIRSHVAHQSFDIRGEGRVARAVGAINRQLYTHTSADKFATLVWSRLDTEKSTLTYCNAGHNPPFLLSNGSIAKLTKGGIVAGLFEDPHYEEASVQLESGDLVVFYTDGVVEAENIKGDQFEENRLEDLLRNNAFLTADDIRSLILDEVANWVRGAEPRDDITVVVVKKSLTN